MMSLANTASPMAGLPPEGARRLLAAADSSLATHRATFGPMPMPMPLDLVRLLESAGLTGRGGAGFPTARKLRSVAERGHGVVVANGSEGEPASAKDRTLLMHAPHLVLDGLALVAAAVGARSTYLVTSRADVAERVRSAAEGRGDRRRVQVVDVVDRFISGEESAVVNRLNGRLGIPSDRMVRVYERGVTGRPTVVSNVETLAHVALVARWGPDWFREAGTDEQPGTFLATVSGATPSPGVYELPYGSSLAHAVRWSDARPGALRAVLVGGFHGAWVPADDLGRVRLTRSDLQPYGASVGAGVLVLLGHDRCGLVESAGIARYLAGQVAGQCGPCINGLPRMADALTALARGHARPGLVEELHRLRGLVTGRGACSHPDGTARFVASTMRVFADEVDVHLGGGCSVAFAR
jgi:NADH:ubiquinone oxidoreductase subunit F (NADH-binding)